MSKTRAEGVTHWVDYVRVGRWWQAQILTLCKTVVHRCTGIPDLTDVGGEHGLSA